MTAEKRGNERKTISLFTIQFSLFIGDHENYERVENSEGQGRKSEN